MHALKGHGYKYRKEYREAVPEFIEAEEWMEALEVLEFGFARGDFMYPEQYSQWSNIIRAVAKSQKALILGEKEKLMRVVRQMQEDSFRDNRFFNIKLPVSKAELHYLLNNISIASLLPHSAHLTAGSVVCIILQGSCCNSTNSLLVDRRVATGVWFLLLIGDHFRPS